VTTRWPHSWRGIVASGHRLLHSNFLRILGPLYPTPQASPRPLYALRSAWGIGVGLAPTLLLLGRLRLHLLLPLFLPNLLQQLPPMISDSEHRAVNVIVIRMSLPFVPQVLSLLMALQQIVFD
jgi:hypothetical protein